MTKDKHKFLLSIVNIILYDNHYNDNVVRKCIRVNTNNLDIYIPEFANEVHMCEKKSVTKLYVYT